MTFKHFKELFYQTVYILFYFRFQWVAAKDVEARTRNLKSRFEASNTVPHTRKYHSYKPIDESTMEIKITSFDNESKIVKIQ